MSRFDYWTHGVSTFVEWPREATEIRHAGFGTVVKQPTGTWNWFHLAVPTPTIVDDEDQMSVRIMAFHAVAKDGAVIKNWDVYMGGTLVDKRDLNLTGDHIYQDWHGDWGVRAPLAFSIRVEFNGPSGGEVCFQGAGAGFED